MKPYQCCCYSAFALVARCCYLVFILLGGVGFGIAATLCSFYTAPSSFLPLCFASPLVQAGSTRFRHIPATHDEDSSGFNLGYHPLSLTLGIVWLELRKTFYTIDLCVAIIFLKPYLCVIIHSGDKMLGYDSYLYILLCGLTS